jgi:hypothetical protein
MKYCTNCGAQIDETAKFCQRCGSAVSAAPEVVTEELTDEQVATVDAVQKLDAKAKAKGIIAKVLPFLKKHCKLLIAAAVVLVAVFVIIGIYNSTHCSYSSCNNATVDGSNYCYTHKCNLCSSSKKYNSNYCYYHDQLMNSTGTSSSTTGNANTDLKFSNIKIEHNSSYTVVTGTVTNKGTRNYKFVTIKGAFKDSSGKVVDTDSTYAVGSEGLAKGESKTFRMSVKKNTSIRKCDITITGYK